MSVFLETYHVHTSFCDGKNTVEEMAAAAFAQGVKILGFSGHSYIPVVGEYGMNAEKERAYIEAVQKVKAGYSGQMDVLCGMEMDAFSDKPAYPYDYIIGSVHCIPAGNGLVDVDNGAALQQQTVETYFDGDFYAYTRAYFEQVALVRDKTDCTVIGHFDLVAKYNEKAHFFDESDERYMQPAFTAIAALCEKGDAVFEINVGSIFRGLRSTPYPILPFLKEIRAHGGKILFSADAHATDMLLFGGEQMRELAKAAGFASRVILLPGGKKREVQL